MHTNKVVHMKNLHINEIYIHLHACTKIACMQNILYYMQYILYMKNDILHKYFTYMCKNDQQE